MTARICYQVLAHGSEPVYEALVVNGVTVAVEQPHKPNITSVAALAEKLAKALGTRVVTIMRVSPSRCPAPSEIEAALKAE